MNSRIVVDALTEQLLRCLTARVSSATAAQVQRLVDGLDAETCLTWANEITADDVPRFEAGAHPERPGSRTAADFNDRKATGVAPLEENARFLAERPDRPDLRHELHAILR